MIIMFYFYYYATVLDDPKMTILYHMSTKLYLFCLVPLESCLDLLLSLNTGYRMETDVGPRTSYNNSNSHFSFCTLTLTAGSLEGALYRIEI